MPLLLLLLQEMPECQSRENSLKGGPDKENHPGDDDIEREHSVPENTGGEAAGTSLEPYSEGDPP